MKRKAPDSKEEKVICWLSIITRNVLKIKLEIERMTVIKASEGHAVVEMLQNNEPIDEFDFTKNPMSIEDVSQLLEALKQNPSNTRLKVGEYMCNANSLCQLAEGLAGNTTLTGLDISRSRLKSTAISVLLKRLHECPALTHLSIKYMVHSDDALCTAEMIRKSTMLTHLTMAGSAVSDRGVENIMRVLCNNTTLKSLAIEYSHITPNGLCYIREMLKCNTTLTRLDISGNRTGCSGATCIMEGLNINSTLSELYMSSNYIEVAGAQCVMHGLEKNTALTKLDISYNNIGLDGIRYVMSKLGENTTLTHLNLAGNRIKSYALVRALKGMVEKEKQDWTEESLSRNTTLTYLNLGQNRIVTDKSRWIQEILRRNTTLTCLDLKSEFFEQKQRHWDRIMKGLAENTTLLYLKIGDGGSNHSRAQRKVYINRNRRWNNMRKESMLKMLRAIRVLSFPHDQEGAWPSLIVEEVGKQTSQGCLTDTEERQLSDFAFDKRTIGTRYV